MTNEELAKEVKLEIYKEFIKIRENFLQKHGQRLLIQPSKQFSIGFDIFDTKDIKIDERT